MLHRCSEVVVQGVRLNAFNAEHVRCSTPVVSHQSCCCGNPEHCVAASISYPVTYNIGCDQRSTGEHQQHADPPGAVTYNVACVQRTETAQPRRKRRGKPRPVLPVRQQHHAQQQAQQQLFVMQQQQLARQQAQQCEDWAPAVGIPLVSQGHHPAAKGLPAAYGGWPCACFSYRWWQP